MTDQPAPIEVPPVDPGNPMVRHDYPSLITTGYVNTAEGMRIALTLRVANATCTVILTREQMIDLITSRVENAERTMMNNLAADCYSDGTADGSKQIGGLQMAIPTTPTNVYGGIDRNAYPIFRTTTYDANSISVADADSSGVSLVITATKGVLTAGGVSPSTTSAGWGTSTVTVAGAAGTVIGPYFMHRADLVIVAIVVLALLGKLSDSLLRGLEQRLLHWRDVFDSRQA